MAKSKSKSVVPAAPLAASAANVLDELADLIPATKPVAKGGKQKWELPLDPAASTSFIRWIEAKVVAEPVLKRLENSKEELSEYCLREMAKRLFESKSKPSNPELKTCNDKGQVDHQATFLMTDKFKYRFPEVPEGTSATNHFIQVFINLGLHPTDAERLVNNEVIFTPITGIRKLNEMLQGRFGEGREFIPASVEEQTAVRKLVAYLRAVANPGEMVEVEPLTPAEKALIMERDSGITVKSGFYNRVATYVQNVDQLLAIFKVIQPVVYPAYPKFAQSDTVVNQTERKKAAADDIIGTTVVTDDDND